MENQANAQQEVKTDSLTEYDDYSNGLYRAKLEAAGVLQEMAQDKALTVEQRQMAAQILLSVNC